MTPEKAAKHNNMFEVIDWLEHASVDELKKFLLICDHEYLNKRAQMCLTVALSKQQHKAHWSLPWTFWVTVLIFIVTFISMVFAAIAVWPTIREWIQPAPFVNKDASFQSPQSNSVPEIQSALQTQTQATNAAQNTNLLNH